MNLHADLTREIEDSPEGPKIGAFFDLDGTIIAGFSAFEFLRDGLASLEIGPVDLWRTLQTAFEFQLGRVGFSAFVAGTAGMLRGRPEAEFERTGRRLFTERLAGAVYPESRALIEAHQRRGHTLAIVSAATRYQVAPLAADLGIAHLLCTQLEVRDGRFTGEVARPTCYGEGKAQAIKRFAASHGIQRRRSFFYTDSEEDLPALEAVGHPRPTNPTRRLREIAAARRWPVRRFHSRGTPGALDVLRTGLALAGLVPAALLGAPAWAVAGSRRRAVNIAMSTWGELATALAGISVRVTGEEHLWSHRPAVFIFNHQSSLDMVLICQLLRRDVVGVAKQELRMNPIFGPLFAAAGTVFLDRFDRDKAIQALRPGVEALREGLSIAIAPEGTRSPTPRLGRFKKGAFHLAMAAKVPIVPIVFRNTLDALPKHSVIIRPATVDVVVHAPIPTATWSPDDLDLHIAEIRTLYEQTLNAP